MQFSGILYVNCKTTFLIFAHGIFWTYLFICLLTHMYLF